MRFHRFAVSFLVAWLITAQAAQAGNHKPTVTIGSKAFSESVTMGELAAVLIRDRGYEVERRRGLGGTKILWQALCKGELDVYPEYSGTIAEEILAGQSAQSRVAMAEALAAHGVKMSPPLGFANSYGIGVAQATAEKLGLTKISDLKNHPTLRCGFSNEFLRRQEGWPTLKVDYELPQANVRGLDHELAYMAMESGDIDVVDVYTTDAAIGRLNLRVLEDDKQHFPEYEALFLYRADLATRAPEAEAAILDLAGKVSQVEMVKLNEAVQNDQSDGNRELHAAAEFSLAKFQVFSQLPDPGFWERLARNTKDHLFLVVCSLSAAIMVSIPLGIIAARRPTLGHAILTTAEIIQTIPGLALLVLLMPPISAIGLKAVGPAPAIVALFMYSLLPIIRNTYTGMRDIPNNLRESADVLGLTSWARLRLIEVPLSARMILAGIKTTAAINVGYATLGGLIGAGGYGEPIMTGLRLSDVGMMLEGAVPAALLALAVKWLFEFAERIVVPRGLRLKRAE